MQPTPAENAVGGNEKKRFKSIVPPKDRPTFYKLGHVQWGKTSQSTIGGALPKHTRFDY